MCLENSLPATTSDERAVEEYITAKMTGPLFSMSVPGGGGVVSSMATLDEVSCTACGWDELGTTGLSLRLVVVNPSTSAGAEGTPAATAGTAIYNDVDADLISLVLSSLFFFLYLPVAEPSRRRSVTDAVNTAQASRVGGEQRRANATNPAGWQRITIAAKTPTVRKPPERGRGPRVPTGTSANHTEHR
jgi:hypothetical protein